MMEERERDRGRKRKKKRKENREQSSVRMKQERRAIGGYHRSLAKLKRACQDQKDSSTGDMGIGGRKGFA